MPTLIHAPYKNVSDHDRITNHVIKHVIPFAFGSGPDPDNFIFNSTPRAPRGSGLAFCFPLATGKA